MSSRQRWQLQQAAVITNMTSSHNLTCRTFYLCMLQRQRRQLQQRQRQQEIQKRPEGDEKQEPRLDQAHLQQEQRRRRLKIRQDDLPLQLSIPGQCYPPSLYSRVAPCSVQQAAVEKGQCRGAGFVCAGTQHGDSALHDALSGCQIYFISQHETEHRNIACRMIIKALCTGPWGAGLPSPPPKKNVDWVAESDGMCGVGIFCQGLDSMKVELSCKFEGLFFG
eukprot:1162130-Pelagomonas_calceolata.AAC.5